MACVGERWEPREGSSVLGVITAGPGFARREALYDRISSALTLVAPSEPVADFLLHIDGSQASFRRTS